MTTKLRPRALQIHIGEKLAAFAEFQEKVAKNLRAENELAEALREAVPEPLRAFVTGQDVIETLLAHGRYSDRVTYGGYGLKTYEQVATVVTRLGVAWKENVVVQIDEPGEQGIVSVYYRMAQ